MTTPVLVLPKASESFVVFYDASNMDLGGVFMQEKNVVAYTLRQL